MNFKVNLIDMPAKKIEKNNHSDKKYLLPPQSKIQQTLRKREVSATLPNP